MIAIGFGDHHKTVVVLIGEGTEVKISCLSPTEALYFSEQLNRLAHMILEKKDKPE